MEQSNQIKMVVLDNLRKYIHKLSNFLENFKEIDWLTVFRKSHSGGARAFASTVGWNLKYKKVLDYVYYAYLFKLNYKPQHLLIYLAYVKLYPAKDNLHSQFHVGYRQCADCIKEIREILFKNMNFIFMELIFLDFGFTIASNFIYASIDTTECEQEKVKLDDSEIKKYTKKGFEIHPWYSGKQKDHTLKSEIVSTLFIGFIIHLFGEFEGPMGDQPICREGKINLKMENVSKIEGKIMKCVGDGHYTNKEFEYILSRVDFPKIDDRIEYHRKRAKIENINSEIKINEMFRKKFREKRGKKDEKKEVHEKYFSNCCQFMNLKRLLYYNDFREKINF